MEITSLKVYKGSTYEAVLDDSRKIYLHADIIADFGVRQGMKLERNELRKMIYASNFRRAYQYALYRLDIRDYSAAEMTKKLVETYKNEALCTAVVERLTEHGFIDDERLAERLAEKYVRTKKFGSRRARREMLMKGIPPFIAEDALAPYENTYAENLLLLLKAKYAGLLSDRSDRKAVEKVKSSLVRLGYGFDEINRAVKEYFENTEELPEDE
jgi:regulatory protein